MPATQSVKEFTWATFPCLHNSRQSQQEKGQNVWIRPGSEQEPLLETVENKSSDGNKISLRKKPGTWREGRKHI